MVCPLQDGRLREGVVTAVEVLDGITLRAWRECVEMHTMQLKALQAARNSRFAATTYLEVGRGGFLLPPSSPPLRPSRAVACVRDEIFQATPAPFFAGVSGRPRRSRKTFCALRDGPAVPDQLGAPCVVW